MNTRILKILFSLLIVLTATTPIRAEVSAIRIAHQPGLSYLPLMIMEKEGLLQRHARAHGLETLGYTSVLVGNANALNEVLLAGSADVVAGAITVMAVLADRARQFDIHGIAALNCDVHYLNTNNPRIKTLRDFSDTDRIAVSAVKLSIHAIVLQMAAEKEFGPGQHEALDRLTVSLPHPEAVASLLAAKTEITAHLTTTPFKKIELRDSRIHRILSSDSLLGGRPTGAILWATGKFRSENPKAYATLISALKEAIEIIRKDPDYAARVYIEMEKPKFGPEVVREWITDPDDIFTIVPERTFALVEFMQRTGKLKGRFSGWKELFFPEIHNENGS
jgi:sulfonate transport system substrate-binding protein